VSPKRRGQPIGNYLSWLAKRIDRAQTARLSTRIHRGEFDAADREQETVIELGQRLFRDACGPGALWLQRQVARSSGDEEVPPVSDYSVDEDHPMRTVHRLQGAIASLGYSGPSGNLGTNDIQTPAVATDITPPSEPVRQPDPPIEASPVRENAPNEPNSDVHTISSAHGDGHKEFRIDTPHLEHRAGRVGITGKEKMHPAFHRLLTGPEQALLDLSPIFGKSARARFVERKRAGLRRQYPLTPIAFPVAGRRRRLISE
jgi:hypothetical protein